MDAPSVTIDESQIKNLEGNDDQGQAINLILGFYFLGSVCAITHLQSSLAYSGPIVLKSFISILDLQRASRGPETQEEGGGTEGFPEQQQQREQRRSSGS